MSRLVALFGALCGALGLVAAVPLPAGAELSSSATTSWGVTGLATGTFTDRIRSEVFAIEQIGSRIYVGGRFLQATNGAQTVNQPFLAAFDANTGDYIPSFTPQLDNAVNALQASPDGSKLFIGGSFETVNGTQTGGLAAINPTTGALDSWSGRIGGYNLVRNMDLVGSNLYVSGSFGAVSSSGGGNTAWGAVRFDWQTGVHDANWRPVVSGGSVWGIAASPDLDRVYLAGYFNSVNGANRPGGFAAVNASNSSNASGVQGFQVNTTNVSRQYAYDVVVTNGFVFVGGSEHYVQVLTESNLSLFKFHISERNRGDYQDLEVVGDRVYAGCHCRLGQAMNSANGVRWFGGVPFGQTNSPIIATQDNSWIFAIDTNTGLAVTTFIPNINSSGPGIWAIHGGADGCLWIGGDITKAAGEDQYNISRLCDEGNPGGDTERPSTPGAPQVQNIGSDSVDLTWNPSTDNVGVAGYRIYNNANGNVLLDVPGTSGTINGLAAGSYQLYTRAYDAAGNESYRSGFTTVTVTGTPVDTERPSTPTGLIITGVNGATTDLSWNPSTDNVGVTGYRVYDNGTNMVITTVASTTASVTVPVGTSVYVKAFDAAGNESSRTNIVTL